MWGQGPPWGLHKGGPMRRRMMILTALFVLLLLATISTRAPDHRQLSVVINEVCWAGTAANPTAEWIELFNTTDSAIDLEGWLLVSSDGAPFIRLKGILPPHTSSDPTSGYYLLERGTDNTLPDFPANQIYQGALTNIGEVLTLSDASGRIIDTANLVLTEDAGRAWPAGSDANGIPPFVSMERLWYQRSDAPDNWASSIGSSLQTGSTVLRGTPKGENSVYNLPPVARLSIDPIIPHPGSEATFSAEGSDDPNDPITSFAWQFGDGHEATGPVVAHAYAESGQYLLTLTLTDSKGAQTRLQHVVEIALTTPPVADFSVMLKSGETVPRAASPLTFQDESSDADSSIVSWKWEFGDGTQAEGQYATHTYGSLGEYVVSLQVADSQGEIGIQTQSLTIASQPPVAMWSFTPHRPAEGQAVLFNATESFDPDGVIASYEWDFTGNGQIDAQGPLQTASYTYPGPGVFKPQLTVVDEHSQTATRLGTIRVNAFPLAGFQVSRFDPNELEPVVFTDLSQDTDGIIVQWEWDFGDGTTSTLASPHHVYQRGGTMDVTLVVTDDMGATATATATLNVGNLPPRASLSVANSSLPTGSRFAFDASASLDPSPSGSVVRYEWSFDGGATFDMETSGPTLSQAFADHGQRTVQVRVIDNQEASDVSNPLVITITNRAPTVSRVTWTPSDPTDADEVVFTAQTADPDGQIMSWSWVLDSVVLSSSQQLTHIFDDDGTHQVTLQVRDNDGASASPHTFTVPILNAPPVAAFTYVQGASCNGSSIRFDATGSYDQSPTGRIVHVAWDFGDGTNCPGTSAGCADRNRWTPEHCYSEPGTYIVTLVVIDEQGAISRVQKTILIGE